MKLSEEQERDLLLHLCLELCRFQSYLEHAVPPDCNTYEWQAKFSLKVAEWSHSLQGLGDKDVAKELRYLLMDPRLRTSGNTDARKYLQFVINRCVQYLRGSSGRFIELPPESHPFSSIFSYLPVFLGTFSLPNLHRKTKF